MPSGTKRRRAKQTLIDVLGKDSLDYVLSLYKDVSDFCSGELGTVVNELRKASKSFRKLTTFGYITEDTARKVYLELLSNLTIWNNPAKVWCLIEATKPEKRTGPRPNYALDLLIGTLYRACREKPVTRYWPLIADFVSHHLTNDGDISTGEIKALMRRRRKDYKGQDVNQNIMFWLTYDLQTTGNEKTAELIKTIEILSLTKILLTEK